MYFIFVLQKYFAIYILYNIKRFENILSVFWQRLFSNNQNHNIITRYSKLTIKNFYQININIGAERFRNHGVKHFLFLIYLCIHLKFYILDI